MTIIFYPDDVVSVIGEPAKAGEVLLTHEEIDGIERRFPWQRGRPSPRRHIPSVSFEEFDQFMQTRRPPKGTVLVHWIFLDLVELISTKCLSPQERALFGGDVVKRSEGDAMSGVVLNTKTFCTLQPVQTHQTTSGRRLYGLKNVDGPDISKDVKLHHSPPPIDDVPLSELETVQDFDVENIVVYGDWVGRVASLVQGYTLLLSNNTVVEVTEIDHAAQENPYWRHEVRVGDILQTKKGILRKGRWIYGSYDPSIPPIGVLASSRVIETGVTWLRSVEGSKSPKPDDEEHLDRLAIESDKFRAYKPWRRPTSDIVDENLTATEMDVNIASRVRFTDLASACVKYHDKFTRVPRTETSGYDLNVFHVAGMRKRVRVQWQDRSITEHDSVELIPELTIEDEYAAWPGEIAHSTDLVAVPGLPGVKTPSRVGVIQSVKPTERMAVVRWCPNASIHYAIDDDNAGSTDAESRKILLQSIIGLADGSCEEVSLYDIETPGELNVKRGDVVLINQLTVSRLSHIEGLNWLGEIVQERLDGTVSIRLGAATPIQDVVLKREEVTIAIRSDTAGIADYDDDSDDDMITIDDQMDTDDFTTDSEDDDDEDGNSVISLSMREITYEDEFGRLLDESEVDDENWESASEMADVDAPPPKHVELKHSQTVGSGTNAPEFSQTANTATETGATSATFSAAVSEDAEQSVTPTPYTLLEGSAPSDHHFAAERAPPASNMKRIQKEHKILQEPGALPDGVFISTWESRLDLMRVLFVGPQETPYAHAPFIIDLWLSSKFPSAPPKAFFHSWPGEASLGGSGRVNPNLYEDGTICLSLLGTWSGDKQENWSADRSTVLQIVVSVLGLVLVREPYFNEAGYEHLLGTDAAKRPSILYNERTCLRALSFMVSAVTVVQQKKKGLRGLDSSMKAIVQWLYLAPEGPKLLSKAHDDVRATVERSEEANEAPDGMNVLSQGACVQLRRLADRLQALLLTAA